MTHRARFRYDFETAVLNANVRPKPQCAGHRRGARPPRCWTLPLAHLIREAATNQAPSLREKPMNKITADRCGRRERRIVYVEPVFCPSGAATTPGAQAWQYDLETRAKDALAGRRSPGRRCRISHLTGQWHRAGAGHSKVMLAAVCDEQGLASILLSGRDSVGAMGRSRAVHTFYSTVLRGHRRGA